MKLNIKSLSVLAVSGLLIFTGCKRGDDFYISPNSPVEVTPALLLTAIEVSTFNAYESDLVKRASVYMQQNSGVESQALQMNNYTVSEQDFENQWGQLYQALLSVKQLNEQFGAENPHYSGIADILAAMNWGLLTDMWGNVPFSDALKGPDNNYQARFDSQEQVLSGIITILDQAIEKLAQPADANTLLPTTDDLAFGGDVVAWTKVAYTLKARYLNRLSNKGTYNPTAILDALSNGIASSAEDLSSVHGPNPTEANQWYDFQNNRANYILASQTLIDSMNLSGTADPRLSFYFDAEATGGILVGSPVDNPNSEASPWGVYLAGASSTPVPLISYVESKFIEAEVKARQDAPDAASVLNEAITASFLQVTKGADDGAAFATYTPANTDISRIMFEKWVALFGSAEPYNDYRRTGFPLIMPNPAGSISTIPARNLIPLSERVSNPNAESSSLTDKVWFAQ